jgi:hypothetical protein
MAETFMSAHSTGGSSRRTISIGPCSCLTQCRSVTEQRRLVEDCCKCCTVCCETGCMLIGCENALPTEPE